MTLILETLFAPALQNFKIFVSFRYVSISTGPGKRFIFAIFAAQEVPQGCIGFSMIQRKWASLSINQDITVSPFTFDASSDVICSVTLEVDFLQKKT